MGSHQLGGNVSLYSNRLSHQRGTEFVQAKLTGNPLLENEQRRQAKLLQDIRTQFDRLGLPQVDVLDRIRLASQDQVFDNRPYIEQKIKTLEERLLEKKTEYDSLLVNTHHQESIRRIRKAVLPLTNT